MMDGFANSYLTKLLKDIPVSKANQQIMVKICQAMVEAMDLSANSLSDELAELPEQLTAVMDIVGIFCRAILAMLVPIPGYCGSSAKDCVAVSSAKESSLLMMLKNEMQTSWWKPLALEVNLMAGAAKELGPRVKQLSDDLARVLKQASGPEDLNQNLEILNGTLSELPHLVANLRTGATQQLQDLLRQAVKMVSKHIVQVKDFAGEESGSLATTISTFMEKLGASGSLHDSVTDEWLQLQAWQASSAASLAEAETKRWLQQCLESSSNGAGIDLEQLRFQLQRHGGQGFPEDMQNDVEKLYIPLLLLLDGTAARKLKLLSRSQEGPSWP